MAKCNYGYGACETLATTTLTKANGVVVQLCEKHRNYLIALFKAVRDGEIPVDRKNLDAEADHWFVLNKIPV